MEYIAINDKHREITIRCSSLKNLYKTIYRHLRENKDSSQSYFIYKKGFPVILMSSKRNNVPGLKDHIYMTHGLGSCNCQCLWEGHK